MVYSNLKITKIHNVTLEAIPKQEDNDRKYINSLFEFVIMDNGVHLFEEKTEKVALIQKLQSIEQLDAMKSKIFQFINLINHRRYCFVYR